MQWDTDIVSIQVPFCHKIQKEIFGTMFTLPFYLLITLCEEQIWVVIHCRSQISFKIWHIQTFRINFGINDAKRHWMSLVFCFKTNHDLASVNDTWERLLSGRLTEELFFFYLFFCSRRTLSTNRRTTKTGNAHNILANALVKWFELVK